MCLYEARETLEQAGTFPPQSRRAGNQVLRHSGYAVSRRRVRGRQHHRVLAAGRLLHGQILQDVATLVNRRAEETVHDLAEFLVQFVRLPRRPRSVMGMGVPSLASAKVL